MKSNMTTEKAIDILERHNLWRRGADFAEATDPKLLGMAIDKVIEVLRLSDLVGQSEQLCHCGKPEQQAYSPCCSLDCWGKQFE
jgi:hypothetical protein